MSNALALIETEMKTKSSMSQLTLAMGYSADDTKGREKAMRCISSVLMEIKKTIGDDKKDLTKCSPQSIVQATIDAARFDVMIDGRQHAHLVKYGTSATLQVGFRGYLAKVKEHYPDADFVVDPVYEGDELEIWSADGEQHYSLKKKSIFNDGEKNFKGILFAVTYTDKGRLIRKVNDVAKSRVDRARSAAKQQFIWGTDYIEKAKAAAIKASCKVLFASIQGLQDMIRYDNEAHFDMSKPVDDEKTAGLSVLDNLNKALSGQSTPQTIDGESTTITDAEKPTPEHEIIPPAKKAAEKKTAPVAAADDGYPADNGEGDPEPE